jgi:ribosomal protein L11 methyltransferase
MTPLVTLTISRLSRAAAETASDELEALDEPPDAVSLDVTGEAEGEWSLTAYFADDGAARAAAAAMAGASLATLPARDWVRLSLQGLPPVQAGRFQLHGSHDRQARQPGGVALEIDAGAAFGTGHHGTTAGCLLALDRLLKSGQPRRVLDLGCGSGVLALAAAGALRRRVLASDIDWQAVRVTRANAAINGLGPWVRAVTAPGFTHPALRRGAPYSLIFANILARPLIALSAELSRNLEPGGVLILSGLTNDQERLVTPAYRNRGLVLRFRLRRPPWSVLVLQK